MMIRRLCHIIWLRKLTQPVTLDIHVVEKAEVGVTKTHHTGRKNAPQEAPLLMEKHFKADSVTPNGKSYPLLC
jgi:hypothetical protein